MTWAPIAHLQPERGAFSSTTDAVIWACSEPAGLKVIRYLWETIEMALRLHAEDPRVTYLTTDDMEILSVFIAEDPEDLYRSRTTLNKHIAAYGLDDWMSAEERSLDDDHRVEWSPLVELRDVLIASSSSQQFVRNLRIAFTAFICRIAARFWKQLSA